ncbi:hypothetical protein EV190_103151 [Actinorugispora endophytica]|uniref:Uncharacterized protein n=1 Tax=Actinorugispora endophytica TaxID=1605990 RepID=A0A4V3D8Y2_9ACTN|nr:hypothetical protein EV190_103151 [Actinorugispora endophytica]
MSRPRGARGIPSGPRHRQQPHRAPAQQGERVEVVAAPQQAPVQAGSRRAVPGPVREHAHGLAGADRVAAPHPGQHRKVGGAQRAVHHGHHGGPRHRPGEPDHPGARGQHLVSRLGREVHPAVAGQPPLGRRVEAAEDLGCSAQRPPPRSCVGVGGRPPRRGAEGEEQSRQGSVESSHAPSLTGVPTPPPNESPACGQTRRSPVGGRRTLDIAPSTGLKGAGLSVRRLESSGGSLLSRSSRASSCFPRGGPGSRSAPRLHRPVRRPGQGVRNNRGGRRPPHQGKAESWPQS